MRAEINKLVVLPPADHRLPVAETPAAIRSRTGLERKTAGVASSSAGTSSNEVTVESTDGLFSFVVRVAV